MTGKGLQMNKPLLVRTSPLYEALRGECWSILESQLSTCLISAVYAQLPTVLHGWSLEDQVSRATREYYRNLP